MQIRHKHREITNTHTWLKKQTHVRHHHERTISFEIVVKKKYNYRRLSRQRDTYCKMTSQCRKVCMVLFLCLSHFNEQLLQGERNEWWIEFCGDLDIPLFLVDDYYHEILMLIVFESHQKILWGRKKGVSTGAGKASKMRGTSWRQQLENRVPVDTAFLPTRLGTRLSEKIQDHGFFSFRACITRRQVPPERSASSASK